MKKVEWQAKKERWIADTQMFQRIAKVQESTTEELSEAWDSMKTNKVREFNANNIATNRIIQDAAIRAGNGRKN